MSRGADLDRKVLDAVERLGRALRAARQVVATRCELSLLGIALIDALADPGARRVGDLAAELDVTQPTVSDALAALERRGLLTRERDTADRRVTLAALTDAGAALGREIAAELGPVLAAESGTPAEREIALKVLLGEITRLQSAGVITVNRCCLSCLHYQPGVMGSARCLLLDTALPDRDLRVNCSEHEPTITA